jgi:hypothetical protein
VNLKAPQPRDLILSCNISWSFWWFCPEKE